MLQLLALLGQVGFASRLCVQLKRFNSGLPGVQLFGVQAVLAAVFRTLALTVDLEDLA